MFEAMFPVSGPPRFPSDSRQRVEVYVFLLEHADEKKIFKHVDAALRSSHGPRSPSGYVSPSAVPGPPLVRDVQDQAKWVWDNLVSDEAKRELDRRTPRRAQFSSRRRGGRPSGG